MTLVGLRGRYARRAQPANAIRSAAVADVPVVAHIRLSLDILSDEWILVGVWLVLALGCAGGSSFELTRTTAPMRWVVEGWPWPVSYRTHIAVDLCNGGPRPPTECLSGSLVRSLQLYHTHAQERCWP